MAQRAEEGGAGGWGEGRGGGGGGACLGAAPPLSAPPSPRPLPPGRPPSPPPSPSPSQKGKTALGLAKKKNHTEIVKLLENMEVVLVFDGVKQGCACLLL